MSIKDGAVDQLPDSLGRNNGIKTHKSYGYYSKKTVADRHPHVASYLETHKIGNKLPRGKSFDKHRYLEKKVSSSNLGTYIISSLKQALSGTFHKK